MDRKKRPDKPITSSAKPKARRPSRKRSSARLSQDLGESLEQLERAELVRRLIEQEQEYIFKHALTQETACESLLHSTRRDIHRRVGEAYEQLYAGDLDDYAALLAHHYAQAGDDAKTLAYAIRAGDRAAKLYANDEALEHYALALEVADRSGATTEQLVHLFTQRGRVLEVSGKFHQALASYQEMDTHVCARGDRKLELASLLLRASMRSYPNPTFDAAEAQQLLDRALALARELGDRAAEAKVLWNLTLLNNHLSRPEQAIRYGEQALAIIRELDQSRHDVREQMAYILHDLALPLNLKGESARASAMHEQARVLWRELDNRPMLVDNLGMESLFAIASGRFARALQYAEEGEAIAQSIGNQFGVQFNLSNQILAYVEMGEIARACQLADELIRLVETELPFVVSVAGSALGWLLESLGSHDRALAMERQARRAIEMPMPAHLRARAYAMLSRLNTLRGDLAAAQADLAAVFREHDRPTIVTSSAGVAVVLAEAELALARGDPAQVLAITQERMPLAHQTRQFGEMPELLLLRARALVRQGQAAEAIDLLQKAQAQAEAMNARRVLWQILAAEAELEMQRGNTSDAQALRAQARSVVEFIAEHMPEHMRGPFLQLPHVRVLFDPDASR